jgi:hypothetical protein
MARCILCGWNACSDPGCCGSHDGEWEPGEPFHDHPALYDDDVPEAVWAPLIAAYEVGTLPAAMARLGIVGSEYDGEGE